MTRSLEGARISIQILLAQLEASKPVHEQLKQEIIQLTPQLPEYLFSLPGIDPIRAVSLYGETDPITNFKTPSQLVAFAGLDPGVFQTGQYNAPRRRISKRGSPYLRQTLWNIAFQAVYREGDLRTYWLRKRSEGLEHRVAITAAAIKLCHIVWRILTDQRDYLPEGRPDPS